MEEKAVSNKSGEDTADSLLECLVILSKMYHQPRSRESLRTGLPIHNVLTPRLFVAAAQRIGFSANIVERPLGQISKLLLPVVLVLKENKACILTKIEGNQVQIIDPMQKQETITLAASELSRLYSGYCILIRPKKDVEPPKRTGKGKALWFWETFWRYRKAYAEVLLAALFINLFSLISPLFVMNVYDRVVPNNATVTLWVLAIGVFIAYCFDLLLRFLRGYIIDVFGKKADVYLASKLFEQVLNIKTEFKPTSVGKFAHYFKEFDSLRDFFTSVTLVTIVDIPFVALFLLFIWIIGGILVIIPLIAIPIVLIVGAIVKTPLNNAVSSAQRSAAEKSAVLVENVSGIEVIKSFGAEGLAQNKWEESVSLNARYGLRSRFLSSTVVNLTYFMQQLVTIGTIVLGVYMIAQNQLTLGGLIACNILAYRTLGPLGQFANLYTRYQQAAMSLNDLSDIMDLPVERPPEKYFLHRPKLEGNIEFKNVTFQYPHQLTKALDNVSFQIRAGERVGILGKIGSGKSTVQKLILNLYQPQSGSIYIDNIDILQLDPADLRGNIGYVPQDTLLFTGSIRENIALGKPSADDEAILSAARASQTDVFVSRHPSGYDLHVREHGEGLSGGQRQTIAIARAILKKPAILLFDEPTSSMDESSQRDLIRSLVPYIENKTLILISHKLSLLALVTRLIILDNGKLVMDGPKEEVLEKLKQGNK